MRNSLFGWMGWGLSMLVLAGCTPRGRTGETVAQARQAAVGGARAEIERPGSPEAKEVAQAAQMVEETPGCPVKGTCDHSVCEEGKRLDSSCDPCAETVCAADETCCTESWDGDCVKAAGWLCGACGLDGCGDLPAGGACVGDFALRCEGGAIASRDCAEQGLACGALDRSGEVGCLAPR